MQRQQERESTASPRPSRRSVGERLADWLLVLWGLVGQGRGRLQTNMESQSVPEPIRDEEFYRSNKWIFYMVWLRGQGRSLEAHQVCEEALLFRPTPLARFHAGISLKLQGLLEEAATLFRQVIVEQPDHCIAHVSLGAILIDLGQFDEAISVLSIVPNITPTYSTAFLYMGDAWKKKGELEFAIRAYRAGINAAPDAELLVALGDALREMGQLGEAIEILSDATAKYPNVPETHLALGKAFKEAHLIQEARAAWQSVLPLVAKYVDAPDVWREKIGHLCDESIALDSEARILLLENSSGG